MDGWLLIALALTMFWWGVCVFMVFAFVEMFYASNRVRFSMEEGLERKNFLESKISIE